MKKGKKAAWHLAFFVVPGLWVRCGEFVEWGRGDELSTWGVESGLFNVEKSVEKVESFAVFSLQGVIRGVKPVFSPLFRAFLWEKARRGAGINTRGIAAAAGFCTGPGAAEGAGTGGGEGIRRARF